jgi:hypothetical protein
VLGDDEISIMETKKRDTIDFKNIHKIPGHCGKVNVSLTGKPNGYEVTGKFDIYKACTIGNENHKKVNKEWKG